MDMLRRLYRRTRIILLRLILLQPLLLVEDAGAAAVVPSIRQETYYVVSGGWLLPPKELSGSTEGHPHGHPHAISERRPLEASPPPPSSAPQIDEHLDGGRSRRRDHAMPITTRVSDNIFPEDSDIFFTESSDRIFPENSDGKRIPDFSDGERERGLLMAVEAAVPAAEASCANGHSFLVTSSAVPDAEGCYVAVEGTSFGDGFVYDLRGGGEDRNIYPKVITTAGESEALTVAAIVAGHVVAVKSLLKLIVEQEAKCAAFASWKAASPAVLGALYIATGSLHFTKLKEMCNVVPPKGTWGLWYVPGRASFHVKWTGVVQLLAGAGLVAGWFGVGPTCLVRKSAAVLFALTAAVTPANVFMFTHGAQFPKGQKVPVIAHVARVAVQCALLSGMWTLAAF